MKCYRTGEVAALLSLSRRKVLAMCEEGKWFPEAELDPSTREWRIPASDVDGYKAKKRLLTDRARKIAAARRAPRAERETKTR